MSEARVALVTGAAQGIGKAIARRLAADGFDIALNDLPSNISALEQLHRDITTTGRRSYIYAGDVSQDADVQSMVDGTVETLGGLDVLVANAGIFQFGPLVDYTVEMWDQLLAVNARGTFLCYKYAAKAMIAQGRGGRIIGASSVAGKQGVEYASAYSASKFAIRGLTQCAAKELGKHGITVNAYAPGPIDTPMLNVFKADEATFKALIAKETEKTAVGRIGTPDEIAHLVSCIASPNGGFITGQTISVNGGQFFD